MKTLGLFMKNTKDAIKRKSGGEGKSKKNRLATSSGTFKGDTIRSSITIWEAKVEILDVHLHKWKYELHIHIQKYHINNNVRLIN